MCAVLKYLKPYSTEHEHRLQGHHDIVYKNHISVLFPDSIKN